MKRYMLVLISMFLLFVIGASPAMAAKTGTYSNGFPPSNDGSRHGAGSITEDVTNERYIFQTPQDVDTTLSEGDAVTFNVWHGRVVTDVQLAGNVVDP